MPRRERLVHAADVLDGHVGLQEDRRLPEEEIQRGHRGDDESGRDRLRRGKQSLQEGHQERPGLLRELSGLLPTRQVSR